MLNKTVALNVNANNQCEPALLDNALFHKRITRGTKYDF